MAPRSRVPSVRVRAANEAPVNPHGDFVLLWMIAYRRSRSSFSLDRAIEWAKDLKKPLVILEALRAGYEWSSDRIHHFVLQGMADNARRLRSSPVTYYPYVEAEPGHGSGLLQALAAKSAVVVTDDFPAFFLPRMVHSAGAKLPVLLEVVDSNGLLPMRSAPKAFARAFDFRRFLQRELPQHLAHTPATDPLRRLELPTLPKLPPQILKRWPAMSEAALDDPASLHALPIDHAVAPAPLRGGERAALAQLDAFLEHRLGRYASARNEPAADVTSRLSPYLHFGHVSAHEVLERLAQLEDWTPESVTSGGRGQSTGWWSMSPEAESFLDELVTWRELGYNLCAHSDDYESFASLPDWAQKTLKKHAKDVRPNLFSMEQLEQGTTGDPIWNAAQRQLVEEGRIHNYLRMLWGKKVIEWSPSPEQALERLIHLNNKYALDGRNPNSYSGICWCFGRYDRPWAPERPIFGTIRYMSSANTKKKLHLDGYLAKWQPSSKAQLTLDGLY